MREARKDFMYALLSLSSNELTFTGMTKGKSGNDSPCHPRESGGLGKRGIGIRRYLEDDLRQLCWL